MIKRLLLLLALLLASASTQAATSLSAVNAGGCTPGKLISAATTNATAVKTSPGQLYWIYVTNTNAAIRWLKLYNKASAPTVGTDVPTLTLGIPGNTAGAGGTVSITIGIQFTTGIALATTTGDADANSGAVAADEMVINYCTR